MNHVLYLLLLTSAVFAASFTRGSLFTRSLHEKRDAKLPTLPSASDNSSTCKVKKPQGMLDDLIKLVEKNMKTVEDILEREKRKVTNLQEQEPQGICTEALAAQQNRVRIAESIVANQKQELAKLQARKQPGSQPEASEDSTRK